MRLKARGKVGAGPEHGGCGAGADPGGHRVEVSASDSYHAPPVVCVGGPKVPPLPQASIFYTFPSKNIYSQNPDLLLTR